MTEMFLMFVMNLTEILVIIVGEGIELRFQCQGVKIKRGNKKIVPSTLQFKFVKFALLVKIEKCDKRLSE